VRRDLERLVALLAGIEGVREIAMTTNGSLLAAKARALKEAGLGRVTVSLDSLNDRVFQAMNVDGALLPTASGRSSRSTPTTGARSRVATATETAPARSA
jgi:molybdenum cofactor biosynthesis enzyme MoaA